MFDLGIELGATYASEFSQYVRAGDGATPTGSATINATPSVKMKKLSDYNPYDQTR